MNLISIDKTENIMLSSEGYGIIKIGPVSSDEIWYAEHVYVSAMTTNSDAICMIFLGSDISKETYNDMTFDGSTGDDFTFTEDDDVIFTIDRYIWIMWINGDPNTIATVRVTGIKETLLVA